MAAFFQGPSRRIRFDRRSDMATVVRVTKISSALLMIPAIASRTRDITRIKARPARYGRYGPCLLYTSDAADEL